MLFVTIVYVVAHCNLCMDDEVREWIWGFSLFLFCFPPFFFVCIDDASCKSLFWSLSAFSGIHEVS
jgi:hypothetical protein